MSYSFQCPTCHEPFFSVPICLENLKTKDEEDLWFEKLKSDIDSLRYECQECGEISFFKDLILTECD